MTCFCLGSASAAAKSPKLRKRMPSTTATTPSSSMASLRSRTSVSSSTYVSRSACAEGSSQAITVCGSSAPIARRSSAGAMAPPPSTTVESATQSCGW